MPNDLTTDGYILARTASEYERLRAQAAIWSPLTDRVLEKAGLGQGQTALDAGCGPGEAMRLMAKRVGPLGSVTGVDIDAAVGAYGLVQMQKDGVGNVSFHAANLLDGTAIPGAPFDVVFCRFLLLHMDDPVEMVRRLAALTKPGGTLVAMDYVMDTVRVAPHHPIFARGIEILLGTLAGAGRPLDAGVRLGEWFRSAGLPMPHGTDMQGILEVTHADPMLAKVVTGVGAGAVKMGIASADEIARLPDEIRSIAAKGEHLTHWPTVTAAWTRVGSYGRPRMTEEPKDVGVDVGRGNLLRLALANQDPAKPISPKFAKAVTAAPAHHGGRKMRPSVTVKPEAAAM